MQKAYSPGPLLLVAVAIISGLMAAFHMGKVPAALPDITQELQLSLPQAGLVVSIFSLLAAVTGVIMGMFSSRLGRIHAGMIGLIAVAAGSCLGSVSSGYPFLLLSRMMEGLGFVLIAVTMPGLINALCPARYRAIAMGIWGAFIPAAMCLMLVTTPSLIELGGWRAVWLVAALLSLIWLIVFTLSFRSITIKEPRNTPGFASLRQLFTVNPLLVVGVFICYSALFAAVTAFLPSYWNDELNLDIKNAAYLSALVVSGNIAGNVIAGFATARGIHLQRLFLAAFVIGGGAAVMLFQIQNSVLATLCAAFVFTFFSGLIPGGVFASLPDLVPHPGMIPLLVGLVFQGAGIGQMAGPLLLATAVEQQGNWVDASFAVGALAVTGLLLTAILSRTRASV